MKNKIKLPKGWELEKLEDGLYEVIQKPNKLENGKDYIHAYGDCLVINRIGDEGNSGFTLYGKQVATDFRCSNPKNWREATNEEVVSFFEKHLIERYGENWESVKIKECMYFGESDRTNTSAYNCYIKKDDDFVDGWSVWNKNGCLFKEGKWAGVLEEKKVATNLSEIDRPYYINNHGKVREHLFTQSKNQMTSKELCEGILALKQLIAFRDNFHEVHGAVYGNNHGSIRFVGNEFMACKMIQKSAEVALFDFADYEQAKEFYEFHKDLFEELKKLY